MLVCEVSVTLPCDFVGLARSGGRANAHPGADGEERQYERTAGQRQRLSEQLPTPREGSTPRDSADRQGVHRRRLRQGEYLKIRSKLKTVP